MAAQDESWKRARDVIVHTLKLVRKGQMDKVFAALDSAIAEVPEDHRSLEGVLLLRHAAILARANGKRDREIDYTKQALPYAKDYRFAAYNFSQLLLEDGQANLARQYAMEAFKLSCTCGNETDRDLVKAIRKQWPDLAIEGNH